MNVNIIRSKRKTLTVSVSKTGGVIVKAPMRATQKYIMEFVAKNENWILKQQQKAEIRKETLGEPFTDEEMTNMKIKAKDVIDERLQVYAPTVGVSFNGFSIKALKSKWGSCSSKGHLNFNCLLVLAPDYVLDYIVVHELCHRKQMNHSKQFWEEVAKAFPMYKKAESWLKEHGSDLMYRLDK